MGSAGFAGGGCCLTELPKLIVVFLYLSVVLFLFIYNFLEYNGSAYDDARSLLHPLALPIARGSALALNFSMALILLPVCRNLLSLLRGAINSRGARVLDDNIAFHVIVGWTIVVLTVIHAVAHMMNLFELSIIKRNDNDGRCDVLDEYESVQVGADKRYPLKDLPEYCGKRELAIAFSLPPGVTGIVLVLVLFLMVTTATQTVRRSYFEVFWYTHHLFIVFFGVAMYHGATGFIRSGPAPFTAGMPQSFLFIAPGLGFYLIERLVRAGRAQCRRIEIVKVVQHQSKVVEIQMKASFKTQPGQYIFLNCPSIAQFEWHPFTLTSCAEEDFISVHIRVVGDWTETLAQRLGCEWTYTDSGEQHVIQSTRTLPSLYVDGPLGTPSMDGLRYKVAILVGAGIGVTPMASILKSLWYKIKAGETMKIQKLYFIWSAREVGSFGWFKSLLEALETEMAQQGFHTFLATSIYLTGKLNQDQATEITVRDEEALDTMTGLQSKTQFGRPRWNKIFEDVARDNPGVDVGVFLCGPEAIAKALRLNCEKFTLEGGVRFVFNAEHF